MSVMNEDDDLTGIDVAAGSGESYWRGTIVRHLMVDRYFVRIKTGNGNFVIGETYLILASQVEKHIVIN